MDMRIRYSMIEFKEFDIHVRTLRDKQQFFDPEGEAEKLGISSPPGLFLALHGSQAFVWPTSWKITLLVRKVFLRLAAELG